jgi:hypothetical protein
MATVPLPDTPCVRVRPSWNHGGVGEGGVRFYLSYSGSAPSGANCNTLAGDIEAQWHTHLSPLWTSQTVLNEVDVLDIATNSGLSGFWTGTESGSRAGTTIPVQCADNVEFDISRRYRGGKPRFFLPAGVEADLATEAAWGGSYITEVNAAVAAFFAGIAGLSVGSMGTLAHVNLSYYSGYATTTPPWRGPGFKYPPKYRDVAKSDTITGYAMKATIGSQKRRRTATTP